MLNTNLLKNTTSNCSAEKTRVFVLMCIAVGAILVAVLVAFTIRSLKALGTDAWQSAAVEMFPNERKHRRESATSCTCKALSSSNDYRRVVTNHHPGKLSFVSNRRGLFYSPISKRHTSHITPRAMNVVQKTCYAVNVVTARIPHTTYREFCEFL